MSYLWILVFIIALVGFVFYRGLVNEKNRKLKKINAVISLVGKAPQASLRCDRSITAASLMKEDIIEDMTKTSINKKAKFNIDDITWENLDLENMYDRMNYCLTCQGADYLYEILHRPVTSVEKLEALEDAIALGDSDKEELIKLLCEYSNLRLQKYTAGKTYADVTNKVKAAAEGAGSVNIAKGNKSKAVTEGLLNIGYVIAIGLVAVNAAVGVIALLLMASYMILTYFSKKSKSAYSFIQIGQIINIYYIAKSLTGFRQLEKENACFSKYESVDTTSLNQSRQLMKQVARYAVWFGESTGTGSGLDMLLVYLKMLFHIDLVILYKLESNMENYVKASRVPGRFIGFVDASLSIAMWRNSLKVWTTPTFNKEDSTITIEKEEHPLLERPVPASIDIDKKGVLLTGSNASGKSTFLKNTALQLVLAQTVNTVTAKCVKLPLCRVISAMGVKDNLLKGDSYYMAEIKAIKRIYDKKASIRPTVVFLDEILRGTNTKERIAGSAAILKNMQADGLVVFCATHDRELTYILEECFDNYHFYETIVDGDISFNYELNKGRANTSNAISLLKSIGFNDKIISEANKLLVN